MRQFEVSDTRVFDRPQAGRAFFDGLIRDHLDIVTPPHAGLALDRRLGPDGVTWAQVTWLSEAPDGLHAPALCFGDPRVRAILAALLLFSHVLAGFRNRDLVELVASLLDRPYTARQATYVLRRLR